MGVREPEASIQDLLERAAGGERSEELLPLVYAQLRRLAQHRMAHEKPGNTLQATALVHEAYLRIAGDKEHGWASRAQFFAAAAEAMRRILIERARARGRLKRGGEHRRLTLDRLDLAAAQDSESVLALDEALQRLAGFDARALDVVHLRFFAGLNVEETAAALELSPRTVKREWAFARAWLFDEMRDPDA